MDIGHRESRWVIESWPQMERQDRQGQILFLCPWKGARESQGEEKQIHFRPAKSGETTEIWRNIPGEVGRILGLEPK